MTNAKPQPHLQVHSQGSYFHCKSCTKERLRDAIHPRHSLMVLTYGIHQTIGPMKKPHFDSLRMSFCHTYVQDMHEKSSTPDQAALAIFDVCKGHMCDSVHTLLERNKILQVHFTNNCTDLLQPLDLRVNKLCKDKLRSQFTEWYTQEVSKQLRSWYTS